MGRTKMTSYGYKRFYADLDAQASSVSPITAIKRQRVRAFDRITDDGDGTFHAYTEAVEAEANFSFGRGTVRERFERYWSYVNAEELARSQPELADMARWAPKARAYA